MSIFRITRQNHVQLSEDWRLFTEMFRTIGAFTYKESVQTVYFDDNAQRILGVDKAMPRDEYQRLLDRLMQEPAQGEQNLYYVRSGAEKRCLKLIVTRRKDEEIGFVEEFTRRLLQQNSGEGEYDDITGMLRLTAFHRTVQQRMQNGERIILAALFVEGMDKAADFAAEGRRNDCMASAAEVLGRFAGEQVLFTVKGFQEFYVCFFGMDEQSVMLQLGQMRKALAECIISDDFGQAMQSEEAHSLDLHAGVAVFPEESDTLRGLITCAEFALYETQHDSQNSVVRFSQEDFGRKKDEYREEQLFNQIIGQNQLAYHFQPIVDARTGDIIGYEALMRSEHFSPDKLLGLGEKLGRLYDIERATLFNCMRFLSAHQNHFSTKALFINSIPTMLLAESDFNELRLMYEELFGKVVIEITEQSEGSAAMLKTLRRRCSEVGARLAIDDYGSGYANTATLLKNKPDFVKIDRELLDGICKSSQKQQLVAGIIDYAHDNQITVLAEGVEEEDDLKTLIRMGVDLFQGYYTARPTPYLLEEISKEVRDIIVNTNLENSTAKKKIYNAHNDVELNLVDLALQHYTDIHVYRHQLTIVGDPEKTVNMHISIMDNHSCELTFRNVNIIGNDKPSVTIGSYAHLSLTLEGENTLHFLGIRVPEGAYLHLTGDGSLKVDSYAKFGYCIGGDCDSSYGCITMATTGKVELICNGDRGVGIGGGCNPDDSEICMSSGEVSITVGSPNAVGIGSMDGNAIVYGNPECTLKIETNGISSVGIGALTGEIDIRCDSDLSFSGGGSKVAGIGVLNKGTGSISVSDAKLDFFMRSNFGSCIGAIGGNVAVIVKGCKIGVNAEGGEITGVGDSRGDGDVLLEQTELKACILAAKPREAGSKGGHFTMRSSTIIADINEQHNTTGE